MLKKIVNFIILFTISLKLFSLTINDYIAEGNSNYINQNYLGAIESYKEGLILNSNDLKCNIGLSNSFYMLGEYKESLLYINKSIELSKNDIELLNLKARIFMAVGEYEKSKVLYHKVLEQYPYNINAKSGLAELRIVLGDIDGSLKEFEDIVKFSPNSRRLMLSLVVLYDKKQDYKKSDIMIQKAIKTYPKDPVVLKGAVDHYILTGNFTGASLYINELLNVSDNPDNLLLKGRLLIFKKQYDNAISVLTEYLKIDKSNHTAYYLIALSLDNLKNKEKALSIINRAKELSPENEIYRIYCEKLVSEVYLLKDKKRSNYSNWYRNEGNNLEKEFYYQKARSYYLRGIDIDPLNWQLRLDYSYLLKKLGYDLQYIKELEFLINDYPIDTDKSELKEILEIEKSLPKENITTQWSNTTLKNNYKHSIALSTVLNKNSIHQSSSLVVSDFIGRFFTGSRRFDLVSNSVSNGSFSTIFNEARNKESDYFISIEFNEGVRSFSLTANLYLTSSGRLIKNFTYLKTGNNRIFNTVDSFQRDLESILPIVGTVIEMKSDNILVDLGRVDRINRDNAVKVVKKGKFKYNSDDEFLSFDPEFYLSTVDIIETGETNFTGVFKAINSFNLINIGDHVLFLEKNDKEDKVQNNDNIIDQELIEQLLRVN